jgi:enoyl-CoA hydratase
VDVLNDEVLFERVKGASGDLGVITLNRPKALNALTQDMCIGIHQQLNAWGDDGSIKAVVIQGAGEKAFCAGGDIRQIYDNGASKAEDSSAFFWHEYRMIHAIFHFPKPYIALLDGITMGGGCGVSMHGSHRVATEFLMLAMPETGIGFFPDVGGGYVLPRCPDYSGYYLGLTGNRIDCADALYAGLATHAVSRDTIDALVKSLADTPLPDHAAVDKVLGGFVYDAGESQLRMMRSVMNDTFSHDSVDGIMQALEACDDEPCKAFCDKALKSLKTKSPMSIAVAFSQLNRGKAMDFDAVLQMEFTMAWHFIKNHDFYEGVRAALVDKDRAPKWQPRSQDECDDAVIDGYFSAAPVSLNFI